jgi:hypothetical protein
MTNPDPARRRLIATLPSLPVGGALAVAAAAAQAQVPASGGAQALDIERSLRVELDSEEVFAYASVRFTALPNNPPLKAPESKVPSIEGFKHLAKLDVAKDDNQWIFGALERKYILTRTGGAAPGEPISTVIPVKTPVVLIIVANLFVRDRPDVDANKQDAILKAFSAYKFASHGNPHDHAATLLGPAGVTADMFSIVQGWRLEHNTSKDQVFHDAADVAMTALYSSSSSGSYYRVAPKSHTNPNIPLYGLPQTGLGEQGTKKYSQSGYVLKFVSEESRRTMPPRVTLAAANVSASNPKDLDIKVKADLDRERKLTDCGEAKIVKYVPLAVLFAWPEFMVEWTAKRIRIGCVVVEVQVPRLLTRTTKLVVNGHYPHLEAYPQSFIDAVTSCLVASFAVAAVAGLVLSEFATAIKVFRLLFDACIEYQVSVFKKCLIPGLALLTDEGKWSEVSL